MPLELATRLILRSADDGGPLSAERVRALVAEWAEVPEAATEVLDEVTGRNGGRITTRDVQLGEDRRRWDLALVRADDEDDSVDWRAEVTAIFELDRTTFVVRLRRNSTDHRLRPLSGSPAPPRVIRDVLRADGVDCFDGPIRVEPRYRELRPPEVAGFVNTQLVADDRRLPVIALAKAPGSAEGRLDAKRITQVLAGFAHVVLADRKALQELGRQIGNLSLSPGSARLWWPGLELDDDAAVHPHWSGPFGDPAAVIESIRRQVLTVSRDRWREPARVVAFGRALRRFQEQSGRAAAARVVEEIERLRAAAAAERARAEEMSSAIAEAPDADAHEQELDAMAADFTAVRDDLERQRVAAEDAESLWTEAEEQRARLERENRSLNGQLEGLKARLKERAKANGEPPETEAKRFAHEVRTSWEARLTPDDREASPLASFVIREGFAASISGAAADRQKVVDTVMEVACGRAKEIEGRQLHKLRSGSSGNARERKRASDGAIAWRCNIQTNSASARRLHFWQCPGGKLDFVSVVIHDDFSIAD
jgi:hypothetical protein